MYSNTHKTRNGAYISPYATKWNIKKTLRSDFKFRILECNINIFLRTTEVFRL